MKDERDKLLLHIQTLMRMPLQYGSADTNFTIDEVHFGLLKVIPDLKRDEVQAAMSRLVEKGYVSESFATRDGVYGPVYMIGEASDIDKEKPLDAGEEENGLAEEPDMPGASEEETGRPCVHTLEGVATDVLELQRLVFVLLQWGIGMTSSKSKADIAEIALDCIYNPDEAARYLGVSLSKSPHSSLKPSPGRQDVLLGLEALIQIRIASLNEDDSPPPDPNSVTDRVIWYVERDSRISELDRLLKIIEDMKVHGGKDDD